MANIYRVVYQIRKPATASIRPGEVGVANLYIKGPLMAICLANDGGPGVLAAIRNNAPLLAGEVVDVLRSTQEHAAGVDGIWQ
jgi:hypothetical protein